MTATRTQTFAVNDLNDLYVDTHGNIAIVFDIDAVLQNCEHAIKTLLGEMVLAANQGIPYLTTVWTGVPNIPAFEASARAAILAVIGVNEIIVLNAVSTGNTLTYNATIRTIYGQGDISGEGLFNG